MTHFLKNCRYYIYNKTTQREVMKMTYTEYVEQSEAHIRMLDDRIEKLYDQGRDDDAKKLIDEWREANNKLDEYIKQNRKKVSSMNMKKNQNW